MVNESFPASAQSVCTQSSVEPNFCTFQAAFRIDLVQSCIASPLAFSCSPEILVKEMQKF